MLRFYRSKPVEISFNVQPHPGEENRREKSNWICLGICTRSVWSRSLFHKANASWNFVLFHSGLLTCLLLLCFRHVVTQWSPSQRRKLFVKGAFLVYKALTIEQFPCKQISKQFVFPCSSLGFQGDSSGENYVRTKMLKKPSSHHGWLERAQKRSRKVFAVAYPWN